MTRRAFSRPSGRERASLGERAQGHSYTAPMEYRELITEMLKQFLKNGCIIVNIILQLCCILLRDKWI